MATRLLVFMCLWSIIFGLELKNGTSFGSSILPAKERTRRLIPYMTFYIANNQQYRPGVQNKERPYVTYQQQQYAIPVLAPQYSTRPVSYSPRYVVQQPSPLTKMITQNYLAITKQPGNARLQTRLNFYQPQYVKDPHYKQPAEEVPVQYIQQTQQQLEEPVHPHFKEAPVQYKQLQVVPLQYKPQTTGEKYQFQDQITQYKPQLQDQVVQYKQYEPVEYKPEPKVQYKPAQPSPFKPSPQYDEPVQHHHLPQSDQYSTQHIEDQYQHQLVSNIKGDLQLQPESLKPAPKQVFLVRPQYRPLPTQDSVTITQSQEIDITPAPPSKYHSTYQAKPLSSYPISYQQHDFHNEESEDDKHFNSLLEGVSLSQSLPEKITAQNLDSSIKTLAKLLKLLQRANALPHSAKELARTFPKPVEPGYPTKLKKKLPPKDDKGSTPGQAGVDYPAYDEIPHTSFSCKTQRYKGFFGDPETGCQVWHYCDLNGGQASFLCPNGTIFSQVALTCDWWFNVKCESTTQLYVLNERLYKYILPHKPKFPEDYSGPLVDHYLSLKFDEIEEKNRNKTLNASGEKTSDESEEQEEELPFSLDITSENKVRSVSK
ncbi:uncharacterized protein LOC106662139 [Cimex lectularius]|uniref:Chitin-binding type-2 domain-containing protein n=1 Tax=Cimex lectularius TaxID=79782 RepID=A0A8I6TBP6_CIMLE|nr:uncharacterized protein LOC106662139 [Cimex lectularius]